MTQIRSMKPAKKTGGSRAFGTPGGSALIMIFSVLCLTVFAILALSTVLADARLSERYAESVTEYYAADSAAEEIIAALRAGEVPEGVEQDGSVFSFVCPVSENKDLRVRVEIQGSDCTVLFRGTEYAGEWEAEDYFAELWPGF